MLIAVLVVTTPMLLPLSYGVEDNSLDKQYWMDLAEKAWQFYQPGKGVNAQTGLHGASIGWPYFTEWDLGTYIQAVIDARELGLLQDDGSWGFNYRIEKILNFLQTRPLTSDHKPYITYDSGNGQQFDNTATFCIDEGKLYMALYNLKTFHPDLTQQIDQIVKVRQNNTEIVPDPNIWIGDTNSYTYYASIAFKAWGFSGWSNMPASIINCIVSQENVTTYGVKLPKAHICNEPLLLAYFQTEDQAEVSAKWLLGQINSAQEQRYAATGHFTAFAEGNTDLSDPSYVYEYVIDADGTTWKMSSAITPIAYLKVAVAFNAIYSTQYDKNLVSHLMGALSNSSSGFREGIAEDGRSVNNIIDRTNGLILSAANYAISEIESPTPSPTPTQTSSLSSSPSLSPSSSTSTPFPSVSTSASASPSLSSTPSPSSSSTPQSSTSPPTSTPIESTSSLPTESSTVSPSNEPTVRPADATLMIGIAAAIGCVVVVALLIAITLRKRSKPKAAPATSIF
jgi:hypothetical protein